MHTGSETNHEPHIAGATHDATLRPLGVLMVVVGCLWALFVTMDLRAGGLAVAKGAGALILAGVVLAAIGKPQQQS